jgi:hypothetical protein
MSLTATILAADSEPAGGAELSQVLIATGGAMVVTVALLFLALGHRRGTNTVLARMGAFSERVSGLPGWAALPSGVAAGSLFIALFGMYWDISLHIDNGRDAGPLANPAHYFILVGLFGIFAAGIFAIVMPGSERPGRAALRLGPNWYAPVGGVLMTACGAFSLLGFPLDDVWHRLFGQDVTLWGPTHLMLIGGAGMSLLGQAVLLAEGMQVARERKAAGNPLAEPRPIPGISQDLVTGLRRVGLMGGFLIGLSTFQAEFDFGVPQYRFVFEPLLLALAAGAALTAARLWIGRGGALGAALFFIAIRGVLALLVGPVLGQTTPMLPLYLVEALCVEAAALFFIRRPLALGVVGGALIGTVGFAAEWGWSQFAMPMPWAADLMPEGLLFALVGGIAGGVVGALVAGGLRGDLPSPAVARFAPAAALAAVAACGIAAFATVAPPDGKVRIALDTPEAASSQATIRVQPASLADEAGWTTITAWQGGGSHLDHLRKIGPGLYRTTKPIPLTGGWKALVRIQRGRAIVGAPVRLPGDSAIPAKEIPARAAVTRPLVDDQSILQRELKDDVPGWLWGAAVGTVLAIYLGFLVALGWGLGRIGRRGGSGSADETAARRPGPATGPPVPVA